MCSIFGWFGNGGQNEKRYIVEKSNIRGRDGCGAWYDGKTTRSLSNFLDAQLLEIVQAKRVVGNFRATPTTEAVSVLDNLQPYDGIVHNGVIANDKSFADLPIDSMVLPLVIKRNTIISMRDLADRLSLIKGSYAIAFHSGTSLYLATNYKPIYHCRIGHVFYFASLPEMLPTRYAVPVKPYSILRVDGYGKTWEYELKRHQDKRVLVACSSGLDSTTVAYLLKSKGYNVTLVHFKYGCRAQPRELERFMRIADHGGFKTLIMEMPSGVMGGSIVEGYWHKDGIEGTEYAMDWVSARNLLMMSMLTAYAETHEMGFIAMGNNLEESGGYPDNETEFGNKFNQLLDFSVNNGVKIRLLQPLANYMKHEIVKIGNQLGVPWDLTWSCYGDGEVHCGECGPCFMRKKAFERNGLIDPAFK